ncbi:MAG: Mur ligase family protein [Isosphaeraceae bacterium]
MARWFVDRSAQRGIPSVSLRRLLPEARFVGCRDLVVSGCSADSRRLDPGQVFIALRGNRHDGHQFVDLALERGAAAVVVERLCPTAGPLQVVVPDSRQAHARLCHALAGGPSETLPVIGVTGVSGRSATIMFLRAIHELSGARFGLIGASGWSDGVNPHPAGSTLPGPEPLAEMLAAMVERGCVGSAIEADDEALDRRSIAGIQFDAAIALGVEGPEDESNGAVLARQRRQARLFRQIVPGGLAVVNADDRQADLLSAVNLESRRVSFSLEGSGDVCGRIERMDASGTRLRLFGLDREATVTLRPIGRRNATAALAAATLAWARGLPTDFVVAGLEAVARVPGQLEPLADDASPFLVVADRARTGLELRETLAVLREVCPGRIHALLSVGDGPSSRASLAGLAEVGVDRLVLTLDDPRAAGTDPVLDGCLASLRRPGRVRVELDRRLAIEEVLSQAVAGDAVLIIGRGVHTVSIRPDRALPVGDRALVARWLRQRRTPLRRSA